MRRFLVEVALDAFLLFVIVLFLGIFSVAQPFPFGSGSAPVIALRDAGVLGFFSWAAILVLVNRFARPVLVALFGRLLFSTMGLFVVVINAMAIYITAFFAPIKIAVVAEPTFLWIIAAAALYTGLSTVLETVLGLNRPDLAADRTRGIWKFLSPCRPRGAMRSSRTCVSSRSTTPSTRPAWTSRWPTRRSAIPAAGSTGGSSATGIRCLRRRGPSGSSRCSSSLARPT